MRWKSSLPPTAKKLIKTSGSAHSAERNLRLQNSSGNTFSTNLLNKLRKSNKRHNSTIIT